jgi:hypothetical protein
MKQRSTEHSGVNCRLALADGLLAMKSPYPFRRNKEPQELTN